MSFISGLSGIAAANTDLEVTGNNIANASTTGFKASRAEFGDAYTNSFLGSGTDKSGSGVNVTNIGQKFEQGSISQTTSVLDLAIDGNGFFVTEYGNGDVTYTRSGIFGIDKDGYVVSNQGANLQGFGVNQNGVVTGVLTDLRVDATNQPPRGTHAVDAEINVPAGAMVLEEVGSITTTDGLAIGVAQVGPAEDTVTTLTSIGIPTTAGTPAQLIGGPIGFSGVSPGVTFPWQPNSTEAASTLDIVVQGPNINGGISPLTATIQPFSDDVVYSSVQDLSAAINASILGDPELAGKVETVVNSFGGITWQTAGAYATDGSSIASVTDNVNTLSQAEYLNFGVASITVQATDTAGLNIVAADTGSTLTAGVDLLLLDSLPDYFDAEIGNVLNFNINVAGNVYPQSFEFGLDPSALLGGTAADGYDTLANFITDLNSQLTFPVGEEGLFQLNGTRLEFVVTGATNLGPNNVSFTSLSAGTTSTVTMDSIGMTSASIVRPTLTRGQTQNDQLQITLTGTNAGTAILTLSPTTHADTESLVNDINAQIAASLPLDGNVTAYEVDGILHFALIGTVVATDTLTVNALDGGGVEDPLSEAYLGIDVTTVIQTPDTVAAVAGTALFADDGFIDLTSDPGQAVSLQGNEVTNLEFSDLIPGTPTQLTSSTAIPTVPIGDGQTGAIMTFSMNLGGVTDTITLTVPNTTGWTTTAAFTSALQSQINLSAAFTAAYGANSVTVAADPITNNLLITADDVGIGPNSISITDLTSFAAIPSTVNPTTLGISTTSVPAPTVVLGEADEPFNNQLQITVDGGVTQTLTIPQGDYETTNQLLDIINSLIQGNPTLADNVVVSEINDRLVFERTEVGAFPFDLSVTGTSESLENFGLTSATKTLGEDAIDRENSFRVNLNVPAPDLENRSGSVEISLNEAIYSIQQLAAAINRELASVPEDEYIGVIASVGRNADDEEILQFLATEAGEGSQISITNIQALGEDINEAQLFGLLQTDQYSTGLLEIGEAMVTNGYPEQSFVLYDEANDVRTNITLDESLQASQIASELSSYPGLTATATTTASILADDYVNNGDMNIFINGQVIESDDFQDIVDEINSYSGTSLNSISADLDDDGNIVLTSSVGIDISVSIESEDERDGLTVQGISNTAPVTLGRGDENSETNARIGGSVEIILNEGFTMIEPDPRITGLFNGLSANSFEEYVINAFDPNDPDTYNETSSLAVYDSLGNQHTMQLYYVKNPDNPANPGALNSWTVHALIDGENIGDPDATLPFPDNLTPTVSTFTLNFNADGTLDEENTGEFLISNWDPIDDNGDANGAYMSLNVSEGGGLPIPDPNVNSNFAISFAGTTQYGGPFARYDFNQDGYASGQLSDLEIDDDGTIYARFTNGETDILGQVALAAFENTEGLNPVGQTEWQASFESGEATIGVPGTAQLGTIQSAALEQSTVDLSQQLVQLIIAQRNYQASAKTIETANAVTQTIINLR